MHSRRNIQAASKIFARPKREWGPALGGTGGLTDPGRLGLNRLSNLAYPISSQDSKRQRGKRAYLVIA